MNTTHTSYPLPFSSSFVGQRDRLGPPRHPLRRPGRPRLPALLGTPGGVRVAASGREGHDQGAPDDGAGGPAAGAGQGHLRGREQKARVSSDLIQLFFDQVPDLTSRDNFHKASKPAFETERTNRANHECI